MSVQEQRDNRSVRADSWERFVVELDRWIAENGDARVQQSTTVTSLAGERYALGQRVKNARLAYRRGALSDARASELEARQGWSWDGYASRSALVWEQRIAALRAYRAEHGTFDGLESADPVLARWLRERRSSALSSVDRRELERIPGALELRKGRLEEFLTAMRSWLAADPDRGAGDVRYSTVYRLGRQQIPLGRRAAYWRARHAEGKLPADQIAQIEALPGWAWRPSPDASVGRDEPVQ